MYFPDFALQYNERLLLKNTIFSGKNVGCLNRYIGITKAKKFTNVCDFVMLLAQNALDPLGGN